MSDTISHREVLGHPAAGRPSFVDRVGRGLRSIGGQNLSLLIALAILVAIIGSQEPDKFFRPANLLNIGLAVSLIGLVAMAQTVVMISGGLDISVGSIVGLAAVAAALAVRGTDIAAVGVLGGLAVGAAAGLFNGLLITAGRVNPVIATLATLSAFRGLAFIITNGSAVGVTNKAFNALGSGRIGFLPIPLAVLLLMAVAFIIFLRYTDIGRNIYAMGGNPVAARLAGINLNRYRLGIYTLSGLVAGVAAILLTARTTSGQPASGSQGLEFESITAAVLGGTALSGGKGTIVGTLLGVLIIGTLNNGMILLNVPTFYQLVARGGLLLVAVMIQELRPARGWLAWRARA